MTPEFNKTQIKYCREESHHMGTGYSKAIWLGPGMDHKYEGRRNGMADLVVT